MCASFAMIIVTKEFLRFQVSDDLQMNAKIHIPNGFLPVGMRVSIAKTHSTPNNKPNMFWKVGIIKQPRRGLSPHVKVPAGAVPLCKTSLRTDPASSTPAESVPHVRLSPHIRLCCGPIPHRDLMVRLRCGMEAEIPPAEQSATKSHEQSDFMSGRSEA